MHRGLPMRSYSQIVALLVAVLLASPAKANPPFPNKPVIIIVGSGAGSGPDVLTRIVADRLSQLWGHQIVVMNKPGPWGSNALQSALAAPPDGHTLVVRIASSFLVWPELQKEAAAAAEREFTPLGLLGVQPMVIAVNPGFGANTLGELFSIARQRPDEILFGGFRATIPHLTSVRLAAAGSVKWRFIPSLTARAVQDAMGGSIHGVIESAAALESSMGAGLLKGLAVASASRLPELPDLPTVAEAMPELGPFEAYGWVALVARASTPSSIIEKINKDLNQAMHDPQIVHRLAVTGTYPRLLSLTETAEFIKMEKDRWRPVVQSLDLSN